MVSAYAYNVEPRGPAPVWRIDSYRLTKSMRLTATRYFYNRRNMERSEAVTALAALAQDNRLDVFRLLVQTGPDGLPAGAVAMALGLAPNTLTFHFDRLRTAGLITVRREGRSMIYAARFDKMNELLGFLSENCCGGAPEKCPPAAACKPVRGRRTRIPA
jgi:ArsR family transcriptional regulator, arsenate/arsenite/antimonite-responsive transcriptional repressor